MLSSICPSVCLSSVASTDLATRSDICRRSSYSSYIRGVRQRNMQLLLIISTHWDDTFVIVLLSGLRQIH